MPAPSQRTASAHSQDQVVMALWDSGKPIEHIARKLGMRRKSVTNVVASYNDPGEHTAHCRSMIAGSAALKAAIESARPSA